MKYHEGLQLAANDGGELETTDALRLRAPLERSSSLNRPEPLAHDHDRLLHEHLRSHQQLGVGDDTQADKSYVNVGPTQLQKSSGDAEKPRPRRICGLRKRTIALIVVSSLTVIAIVLGAVLGTELNKSSEGPRFKMTGPSTTATSSASSIASAPTSTPLQIQSSGRIAAISQGQSDSQGDIYGYYQASNGSIWERSINNSSWSAAALGGLVVSTGVAPSTPMSAIAYNFTEGSLHEAWRFVFFLDHNGRLMMTNRTESKDWSEPASILDSDSLVPNDTALEAMAVPNVDDNTDPSGLRVYYGSASGGIHEVLYSGIPGSNGLWYPQAAPLRKDSDSFSGVSTTSYNGELHIYVRNNSTGVLNQWRYLYHDSDWAFGWVPGANSTASDPVVASGSDITACSDQSGNGTDHIFYQTVNGSLVRALSYSGQISNFEVLVTAAKSTKLTSVFGNENIASPSPGAVVYYEEDDSSSEISFLQIDRQGNRLASGKVQGGKAAFAPKDVMRYAMLIWRSNVAISRYMAHLEE